MGPSGVPSEALPSGATSPGHRANWRVPKIILAGPHEGPPPLDAGGGGMPGSTPHRKPPAPEGVPPPSGPSVAPAAKPSSELASTQNHPSWPPPMRGAPPLDAGAKGACLEAPPPSKAPRPPPREGAPQPRPPPRQPPPSRPRQGVPHPFEPPSWPTSSPTARLASQLASTQTPQNAHLHPGQKSPAPPPPRCHLPVPSPPWSLSQLASSLAAQMRARGPSSGSPLQAPGAAGTIDGEV
ncbi:hypothetical protein HAV15_003547 [Penicillium sp. str. |nr:hypothetical protein HAV15_003547 [Penicillium sp. str. \